jgi:hypothetical protein
MKMDLKRVEPEEVELIQWVQDMDQRRALVNNAMEDEFYLPRCYAV